MRIAILFPLILLAACASTGSTKYPSLATRPGERVSGIAEPVAAPAAPPATAATGSRIARLRAQAQAASRTTGMRIATRIVCGHSTLARLGESRLCTGPISLCRG